jgi:DNA-binding transcriptional ArsR family regulator
MREDRCDLLCLDLPVAERVRASRLNEDVAGSAAGRARALSDPTRLTIAAALRDVDELCVCDLSWIMERSQNLVSHHVRALRDHGVVKSRREGKMVMYALTDEGRALLDVVLASEVAMKTGRHVGV